MGGTNVTDVVVHVLLSLPLVGAFAMFALGIVVMYRASGVLNLAHGAMAMVPAYVCYSLWRAGVPVGGAFILGTAAGGVIGFVVERFVLRRLRGESNTVQTVGTVAVLGILIAGAAKIWGTATLAAPAVFPGGGVDVGRSVLHATEIGLFVAALVAAASFFVVLQKTPIGLSMRGAADNRIASALCGVDPDRMTSLAWVLGGILAGAGGILLASATNLHPYTLSLQVLPAFVAALLGGFGSLQGAIGGAAIVGVVQGIVPSFGPLGRQTGTSQLVLAVLALLAMALRGRARLSPGDVRAGLAGRAGTHAAAPLPSRARWTVAAILIALPWLPIPDSLRADASLAAIYTIVAVSLVILTGWVGQISLAHGAFVGVSAFTTGLAVRGLGVPFPVDLPLAAGAASAAAAMLGIVALRVRGLYLAVATLIFGWMADGYLFRQNGFVGEGGSSSIPNHTIGRSGGFPFIDFTDRRTFYYVTLAAAALAIGAAANLRDSRTGRAFFAVRGSEIAAASLGIDVTRTKLVAFALSGALAGVAGNLIMLDQLTATPAQFDLTASLFFLSMAVTGGVTRLGGAVASAVMFAGLYEVFYRVRVLDGYLPLVSPALLLAVLLAYRGGLASLFGRMADRIAARAPRPKHAASLTSETPLDRIDPYPGLVLEARNVTVRFGGLTAVQDASLEVRAGEIVGLIGPNGAGKTTMFNAISGIVTPARGSIHLFERDVTAVPVHERARAGLGRTFQVLQLFGELTVFENLLVATHTHARSGLPSHVAVSKRAIAEERAARGRVRAALRLARLDDVADRRVAELPFGTLRRVEVARTITSGARFVMLDEPASGLDSRETVELSTLVKELRATLGLTILVIEHDIAFVTGLSDRIYVMDQGEILTSGVAAEIRSDPAVIAAYLGTSVPEPALV